VAAELDKVLATGADVNMYMIYGGSNFGFHAGSDDPPFRPSVTSSDYDAPISEAGDLRQKYFAIKEVIKKYVSVPDIKVNETTEKGHYGPIELKPISSLVYDSKLFEESRVTGVYPKTFEELGQNQGFVLYQTTVQDTFSDPAKLEITGLHDRGYVFVDGELQVKNISCWQQQLGCPFATNQSYTLHDIFSQQGILSRMYNVLSIPIRIRTQQQLQIFVENQGRVCYGPNMKDFKGIVSNVTIGGKVITDWTMIGLPFSNLTKLSSVLEMIEQELSGNVLSVKSLDKFLSPTKGSMTLWTGSFRTGCSENPRYRFE